MKPALISAAILAAVIATPAMASCSMASPSYDVCQAIEANTAAIYTTASANSGMERELQELRRQVEKLTAAVNAKQCP